MFSRQMSKCKVSHPTCRLSEDSCRWSCMYIVTHLRRMKPVERRGRRT